MRKILIIPAILSLSICKSSAQMILTAKDAAKYAGKKVTVCDSVFSKDVNPFYVTLFLGGARPDPHLAVSIRFSRKYRQHMPENYFNFEGKKICVTGIVSTSRGGAYIKVNDPSQIR